MVKLVKKPKGEGYILEVSSEEDILPPVPYIGGYESPNHRDQGSPIYILGDVKNLKESLMQTIALSKDARRRFGDGGIEGMLKSTITREALHELGMNPETRFRYLEQQVSWDVNNGRYLREHREYKQVNGGEVKPSETPIIKHMKEYVPTEQHGLYLSRGIYVNREGGVYEGMGYRAIADLSHYLKPRGHSNGVESYSSR